MPSELIIFPVNGNGIEAMDCIDPGAFIVIGFIDDNYVYNEEHAGNWRVEDCTLLGRHPDALVLTLPGGATSFHKRKDYIDGLSINESRFTSVVHPTAVIGRNERIGKNCKAIAGVVITSNARIGDHVCILPNSLIHHDARAGDYALVGSSVVVAGGTTIVNKCYTGSGCNLINGIRVGDLSLVGLGSNVIESFSSPSRIAGNPAKEIPSKKMSTHG